ncbi:hypothetical protein WJX73_000085 [Symbiochloris irregularis]|uniref:Uncharacterized protein n=1 Tax=Symbiochloris irregularis TaxID=706552 RepID=A0AAW1PJN5_9CHLO
MSHSIPSPPVHQDSGTMPPLRKPALSSRPISDPIQMSSGGAEKRQCSRPGPPKPSSSFSSLNWKAAGSSFTRENDEIEQGADEIRSILQQSKLSSTPRTFLGMSPPTRAAGAMNPLVQDWTWKSNVMQCSHSNLQALREMDARGVGQSFGAGFCVVEPGLSWYWGLYSQPRCLLR